MPTRFRRPTNRFEYFLNLFFRRFKLVRKILGGIWEKHELEPNYFCWFWMTRRTPWLDRESLNIVKEEY
jgi:hypothetical protein